MNAPLLVGRVSRLSDGSTDGDTPVRGVTAGWAWGLGHVRAHRAAECERSEGRGAPVRRASQRFAEERLELRVGDRFDGGARRAQQAGRMDLGRRGGVKVGCDEDEGWGQGEGEGEG